MDPVLLAALIRQFAIPEIIDWLQRRKANGQTIDDAAAREKLGVDADEGIAFSERWLADLAARPTT